VWKKNVATTKDQQHELGGGGGVETWLITIVQLFCGKLNAFVL
jgi:hypothetical protein